MEGLHLPRARFLAPPEIVLIELLPGKIHSAVLQNAGPEAP
jgi:hypothetical protein